MQQNRKSSGTKFQTNTTFVKTYAQLYYCKRKKKYNAEARIIAKLLSWWGKILLMLHQRYPKITNYLRSTKMNEYENTIDKVN